MKKIIIIFLALAVILGFLFWKFGPNIFQKKTVETGPINLTYWGLWEDEKFLRPVLAEFQKTHPNIKVTYERKSSTNYRTRLQTQIQAGQGPDIFRIHNSWLPLMAQFISPAPSEIFSVIDYNQTFYPVAADSFIRDNTIYAAPIGVDGLVLFYNEDILKAAGVEVPKNWKQLVEGAVKMTVVNGTTRQITTAGLSMGTTGNVDHWSDIVGLLLLQQPNVNLTNVASPSVAEIIKFYTSFVTDPTKKTWDANMPPSTQAFAAGRLAFYFAPSWRAHELRVANPNLKFKTAPVPQLPGKQVAWASFWGETVSVKSAHPKEAWEFVKFLTEKETEKIFYAEASKERLFGEPYSRVDMAGEVVNDPLVGAVIQQGPYYKFWYLASNTFDAGINDEMIKYWEDGVNAVVAGADPQSVLPTVQSGVKQILDKYNK